MGPELAPGWTESQDANGDTYYTNHTTQETQREVGLSRTYENTDGAVQQYIISNKLKYYHTWFATRHFSRDLGVVHFNLSGEIMYVESFASKEWMKEEPWIGWLCEDESSAPHQL